MKACFSEISLAQGKCLFQVLVTKGDNPAKEKSSSHCSLMQARQNNDFIIVG